MLYVPLTVYTFVKFQVSAAELKNIMNIAMTTALNILCSLLAPHAYKTKAQDLKLKSECQVVAQMIAFLYPWYLCIPQNSLSDLTI